MSYLLANIEEISNTIASYPVTVGRIRESIKLVTDTDVSALDMQTAKKALSAIRHLLENEPMLESVGKVADVQQFMFKLEKFIASPNQAITEAEIKKVGSEAGLKTKISTAGVEYKDPRTGAVLQFDWADFKGRTVKELAARAFSWASEVRNLP